MRSNGKYGNVLRRIQRTLRREGLRGLWARLRYPKKSGGAAADTPAQTPPFCLTSEGADPALTQSVTAALRRVLGPQGLAPNGMTAIHLTPSPGDTFGTHDVLLFNDHETAVRFLADVGRGALAKCGAVLLPDVGTLEKFLQAGIGDGRLFVLPSLSKPPSERAQELAGDVARWLIASGAVSPQKIDTTLFPVLSGLAPGDRICLGLPESAARRANFLRQNLHEFRLFNGLRQRPSWQGAGWSYATIARAALTRNATPLLVCEDDMQPEGDFRANLASVEAYLKDLDWDLFSGLLTDVPEDCCVHHVEKREGLTFIHLGYATGMVLNMYNRRALARLAAWSPAAGDPKTDTIDEWLSRMPDLRVVTSLPFIAGHDPDSVSTVFGFANRRYDSLISASERRLAALAEAWLIRQ